MAAFKSLPYARVTVILLTQAVPLQPHKATPLDPNGHKIDGISQTECSKI